MSTTGTDDSDFSSVLPTSGDLLLTATNTTDFNQYEVPTVEARYLKLIGYGRFNSDGDTRKSVWSAVGEIEFYGSGIVAVDDNEFANRTLIYPVPTKDILHVENINHVSVISIYGIDGAKIMEKKMTGSASAIDLNVSSIPNGSYILVLKGEQVYRSKPFIISH